MTRRRLLALAGSLALACSREGDSRGGNPADRYLLMPRFPNGDMLAGPDWLRELQGNPTLRLLDLSALPDYRDGHIPGALHVWWQDLIEINNPVYGMLVGSDGRQDVVRGAGISPDSIVVAYDRSGGVYASRLVWALRYMGFTNSRLLSGGLQGWIESGGDLSNDAVDVPASAGISDARDESVNIGSADLLAGLGDPARAILDTRTADEIDETWRGQLRRGRIPGSIRFPRNQFLAGEHVPAVLSPETLIERLAGVGLLLEDVDEIVVYGLHATLASLPWLVLTALAGPRVRLYDGCWSEWGARADLPVEALP